MALPDRRKSFTQVRGRTIPPSRHVGRYECHRQLSSPLTIAKRTTGRDVSRTSPRLAQGALFCSRNNCLAAYRNAGLSIQRTKLIDANAVGGGRDYQFHPHGIRTFEIRSLGRLAQGVEAVLLLPGVRVGETRQFEYHP